MGGKLVLEYRYNPSLDENVFCPIRSEGRGVVPCNMRCAWYDWGIGRCILAKDAMIPDWMQHKKERPEPTGYMEEHPED